MIYIPDVIPKNAGKFIVKNFWVLIYTRDTYYGYLHGVTGTTDKIKNRDTVLFRTTLTECNVLNIYFQINKQPQAR